MSTQTRDRSLREQCLNAAGHRCRKCRKKLPANQLDADHIIELIDGGPDTLDNLQALCKPCHKTKTAKAAQRRARGPLWPRLLQAGLVTGLGVGAITTPGLATIATTHTPPALPTLLQNAAGGGLTGVGLAAAAAFGPGLARRWWTAGAPKAEAPAKVPEQPTKGGADRVQSAVNELLPNGRTVAVSERDGSYIVTYEGTGFADHNEERRLELVAKVAAKLGGRWLGEWDTENDRVVIRRRAVLPEMVPHPGFTGPRPWHVLPFAIGPDGPVAFDLKVTSHLLITGATNSGKTSVMRSLIVALADSASRGEVELVLGDPKRCELLGYRGWPGVRKVATDPDDLWEMPLEVRDEMDRRYASLERDGVPLESHKPLVVVLDEYEHYVDVMGDLAEELIDGKPRERTTQKRPASPIRANNAILRLARRCNIHMIVGTQRPDADFMGGKARDQMQGRCAVGQLTQSGSTMAFGSGIYGRDVPAKIKGRATVQVGEGTPFEVQSYWAPDPALPDLSEADRDILRRVGGAVTLSKVVI